LKKRNFTKRKIVRFVAIAFGLGMVVTPLAMADMEITSSGDVGIGTSSPVASLEVRRSDGSATIKVDENGPFVKRQMFILENNGAASFRFRNSSTGRAWTFAMTDNPPTDEFVINDPFSPGREMFLDQFGNAEFEGSVSATAFNTVSDRNLKDRVELLDGREVLQKVMNLPISRYCFKDDRKGQRNIGPMAQDLHSLFEVGPDNRHINVADTAGIALTAIQQIVRDKDAQIAELEKRLLAMEKRLENLTQNIVQNDLLSSLSLNNIYR
jgi:hypothetical protein